MLCFGMTNYNYVGLVLGKMNHINSWLAYSYSVIDSKIEVRTCVYIVSAFMSGCKFYF